MWKPWKNKNENKPPAKPRSPNRQLAMIWEQCFNHIPSQLEKIDWRLHFQDIKINFVLAFLAILVGLLTFLAVKFL